MTSSYVTEDIVKKYFKNIIVDSLLRGKTIPPMYFAFDNNINVKADYIINVPDEELFFQQLTCLINIYSINALKYDKYYTPEFLLKNYINTALWLKMTPEDFNNIHGFLYKQIEFVKNDNLFNMYDILNKNNIVDKYMNYDIVATKKPNNIWFETISNMSFELVSDKTYQLPSIHFGVCNNTCYIYGIQNIDDSDKDKKIQRDIYKINKNITNQLVHPSFILSMKTFIKMLIDQGIYNIEIPLLEPLSYDYHKKMSDRIKNEYNTNWKDVNVDKLDDLDYKAYQEDKKIYDKFVDKENLISKLKVDNLANLFIELQEIIGYDYVVDEFKIKIKLKQNEENLWRSIKK